VLLDQSHINMNSHLSRRRFLKTSAAVAAASTLPKWFIEESRAAGMTPIGYALACT